MATVVPRIRPAQRADGALVARIFTDAFEHDPLWRWMLPVGGSLGRARSVRAFAALAAGNLRRGEPVFVAADGHAAAVWHRPSSSRAATGSNLGEVAGLLLGFGRHLVRVSRAYNQLLSMHPAEPYWYLETLGVRQAFQGRGLGSALIAERLPEIEESGHVAYLESSNERNVPLYERFGFRVVEETRLLGTAPPVWRMLRPASRDGRSD